jgi:actin
VEAFPTEGANLVSSQYVNSHASHPIYRGAINDWDEMETLWRTISETVNLTHRNSDGSDNWNISEVTSVFLVESNKTTAADRAKWAELLFETYHAPSICMGNSSTLSIFASGRTSGLAVECGAGHTSTVPIFEGLALKHAIFCVDHGGQDISYNLKRIFNEKGVNMDMASAKAAKERMAFAYGHTSRDMPHTTESSAVFSLPDGTDVTLDSKMFRQCTESLFVTDNSVTGGLVNSVYESIALCDESVRRDLANNIILSGGTSMLPGLGDRLQRDLVRKCHGDPISHNILVVPNSNYREKGYSTQRKYAPWIGGSLMGSFQTYHKTLKITRQEWEENPDMVLSTKCF